MRGGEGEAGRGWDEVAGLAAARFGWHKSRVESRPIAAGAILVALSRDIPRAWPGFGLAFVLWYLFSVG